jgi:tripartite-type tricarboxylate transporter receptor subunit TctC
MPMAGCPVRFATQTLRIMLSALLTLSSIDASGAAIPVAQSPEMMVSMGKLGFESKIGSAQDFAAFVGAEIPCWTAVMKASGVKSQ